MKLSQFKLLANALMTTHYGITLADSGHSDTELQASLNAGLRPYQVVNDHAFRHDLYRIDGSDWMPPGPLVQQDELAVIAKDGTVLIGDCPVTCGSCGARTTFDVLDDLREHHRCLNGSCGLEFIAEQDADEVIAA